MKLRYANGAWCIGESEIHCGQQVKILGVDCICRKFWFYGRFEIAGQNNPVFFTTFGRVAPDLSETLFEL